MVFLNQSFLKCFLQFIENLKHYLKLYKKIIQKIMSIMCYYKYFFRTQHLQNILILDSNISLKKPTTKFLSVYFYGYFTILKYLIVYKYK
jgi:hypothetical protein